MLPRSRAAQINRRAQCKREKRNEESHAGPQKSRIAVSKLPNSMPSTSGSNAKTNASTGKCARPATPRMSIVKNGPDSIDDRIRGNVLNPLTKLGHERHIETAVGIAKRCHYRERESPKTIWF